MSTKPQPDAEQRPTTAGLSALLRARLTDLTQNGAISLRDLGEPRGDGRRALRIEGLPACRDTQFAIDAQLDVKTLPTVAKRAADPELSPPVGADVGADASADPAAPGANGLVTRAADKRMKKPKGQRAPGDGEGEYAEDEEDDSDEMSSGGEIMPMQVIARASGIASSTSRDWHGTEMRPSALMSMSAQFKSAQGVVLTPSHGEWYKAPDWQDVMGRSVNADVRAAPVANAVDPGENQFILIVEHDVWDCPHGIDLTRRALAKQPIGQSIGGWFTDVEILYDEDTGELERVFILDVKLDHCAVTRCPSNPDSMGIDILRAASDMAVRSVRVGEMQSRAAAQAPAPVVSQPVAPEPAAPQAQDAAPAEQRAAIVPPAAPAPTPEIVHKQDSHAGLDTPDSSRSTSEDDMENLDMTDEQIAALAERLSPLLQRATPPVDKDAEIARLTAELDAIRSQPQRRGLHAQQVTEPAPQEREADFSGLNSRSDLESIADTCIEARVMAPFAQRVKAHARMTDRTDDKYSEIKTNAIEASCRKALYEAHRCGALQSWLNGGAR